MKRGPISKIVGFLYEVGTMRKIARAHRQALHENDLSDNISSHSYRVSIIGWHLARMEKVDQNKVVMMCLLHDMAEARSNDHNWIHKRYVKIFEEEIITAQFSNLPFGDDLMTIINEYHERKTAEARIAKDADLIDQLLLLKEYEMTGNTEATLWLTSKLKSALNKNTFFSKSALQLAKEINKQSPSDWWKDIWTNSNR